MPNEGDAEKKPEVTIAGKKFQFDHLDAIAEARKGTEPRSTDVIIQGLRGMDWPRFKDLTDYQVLEATKRISTPKDFPDEAGKLKDYLEHAKNLDESARKALIQRFDNSVYSKTVEIDSYLRMLPHADIENLLIGWMRTDLGAGEIAKVIQVRVERSELADELRFHPDMVERMYIFIKESWVEMHDYIRDLPDSPRTNGMLQRFDEYCKKAFPNMDISTEELKSRGQ
ncbi:MAG: hypothetical protein Q9166_007455 [cf. Caloplaca sp. 2 TL-2023]